MPNGDKTQRCDECEFWIWEHTGIYGIGEGHCPYKTSTDGCDGTDCEHFKKRDSTDPKKSSSNGN